MSKTNSLKLCMVLCLFFLLSCQLVRQESIVGNSPNRNIAWDTDTVKPSEFSQVQRIFDSRCVACHACYNSPCQLNLTSYEGVLRGANKKSMFDFEFADRQPTRLGVDAKSTKEWHSKKFGFYSVVENLSSYEKQQLEPTSVLWKMIDLNSNVSTQFVRQQGPFEYEKNAFCPTVKELSIYEGKTQGSGDSINQLGKVYYAKGMPYGLPPLSESQAGIIKSWLQKGFSGYSLQEQEQRATITEKNRQIRDFVENFLNSSNPYQKVVSRYIYEHIFLAHIYFDENNREFFRLVRSSKPRSEIGSDEEIFEIATRRPTDNPERKFYYLFKKITETIVQKNHILYGINSEKINYWIRIFEIDKNKETSLIMPSYDSEKSLNPFATFKDLPLKGRFRFLLDDNFYHIQSFILGPVCRGQLAVDSIEDHFWVFFMSPESDPMLKDGGEFINSNVKLIGAAGVAGSSFELNMNRNLGEFRKKRKELYKNFVFDKKVLWLGDEDGNYKSNKKNNYPVLTILRHFDNASVLKGPLGSVPKTIWLIDYHIFEDMYYNLVAGYDLFSGNFHHLRTRFHMDGSRVNGQDLFLGLLPDPYRSILRESWHVNYKKSFDPTNVISKGLNKILAGDIVEAFPSRESKTKWFTSDEILSVTQEHKASIDGANQLKKSLLTKMIKDIGSKRLHQKFIEECCSPWPNNQIFYPENTIDLEFKKISRLRSDQFDSLPDVTYILLTDADSGKGDFPVYTLINNKQHFNLDQMSNESGRRDFKNDYLTVFKGMVGSFPNLFLKLKKNELNQLIKMIQKIARSTNQISLLANPVWQEFYKSEWVVSRFSPDFWEVYDQLHQIQNNYRFLESGVIDLSHYSYFDENEEKVYR